MDLRLITSDIVEGKENTIAIHGLYFDGYDTEISFNRDDVLEPLVEMEKDQVCATTGEAFNTIHGDGKLRLVSLLLILLSIVLTRILSSNMLR